MKTIYLLRHAKSSWTDPSIADFDRPLNKRGRRSAAAMGEHLERLQRVPDLVLCSSARRTRETLEHLQSALGTPVPARYEKTIYLAESAALLRRLRRIDDALSSVMLIGHNPGLERLAGMLAADGDEDLRRKMAAKFPTGSLAVIQAPVEHWHDLEAGCGTLTDFVRARELD